MKVRYIGNFPPPYGGVTIKNQLLKAELAKKLNISCPKKISCVPNSMYQAYSVIQALLGTTPLLVGISAAGGKSKLVTKLLYSFKRNTMSKSIYFMMGGTEANRIAENPEEIKRYSTYRCVYAETHSMVAKLRDAGLTNAAFYPNCRKRPDHTIMPRANMNEPLSCVFFSLIQKEKGVDHILTAAKEMLDVQFIFYGHIDPSYETEFLQQVSILSNADYKGVFTGSGMSVYNELSKYDVLLLPTKWKSEGVPGVLAEAKIAGVPSIVSNICYNAEIIEDGVSGIVLKENSPDQLAAAIKALDEDRELLMRLKEGAQQSAEAYYIDNYIDKIINMIEDTK